MNRVLNSMIDGAVRIADALDELLAEAALGFGAAAPFVVDRGDDRAFERPCLSRPSEPGDRP